MAERTNEKFWHSGQNLETKYFESARRALNFSWIGGIYDCMVARGKLRKLMALFVIVCRVHQFHNLLFGGLIFALRLVKFLSGCQQVKSLREFAFLI